MCTPELSDLQDILTAEVVALRTRNIQALISFLKESMNCRKYFL